jgi:diguanylate cyclase (GGDEF)-like protein/PAS domain S-box-containing protein
VRELQESDRRQGDQVAGGADSADLALRSDELRSERELRERMLNRIQDVVYVLDLRRDRLSFISSEISLLLGHPWQAVRTWGQNLFPELMHPEDLKMRPFFHARLASIQDGETLDLQYRMRDASGQWRWMRSREVVLERTDAGEPSMVLGVAEDFTAHKQGENRLREMALFDELTGLRNRRGFVAIAEQYAKIARRQGQRFSVLFFDMDRFKAINDAYGHQEGDAALRDAAGILKRTFRTSDIICRYGGDEFAALAVDAAGYGSDVLRARIRKCAGDWNAASAKPYRIEFSIGVFVFDPAKAGESSSESDLFETALHGADADMYRDKAARRAGGDPVRTSGRTPAPGSPRSP